MEVAQIIYCYSVTEMCFFLMKKSWRRSLKQKLKTIRNELTSDPAVQEKKAKYGRPGVSGRKRCGVSSTEEERCVKTPRFSVSYYNAFS